MKKILISGYYGFGNSGDEAILNSIIKDLRQLDSTVEINVLSVKPELTSKQNNVIAVNRFNIFEIVKSIINCDLLISGGGSLLQDITSTRSLFYYLFIIKLATLFRKKIMLYANGVGPIKYEKNRQRVKNIVNKVGIITLRDEESYNFVKNLGIDKPKILLTADPVLNFTSCTKSRIDQIFDESRIPKNERYIAINVRQWPYAENFEEAIAESADYINKSFGYKIIFIPMFKSDSEIIKSIMLKMTTKSYTLKECYEPEELIGILSNMQIVIAMRLHTLIYSSINSVPALGIVYDPKVKSFMDYTGQDALVDIKEMNSKKIIYHVQTILDEHKNIREKLQNRIHELKELAFLNANIAIDYLKAESGVIDEEFS